MVLPGTLHNLTPDDLADFVIAAATRERWHEDVWLGYVEMTEDQVEQMIRAVGDTLTDRPMTRAVLADAIAVHLADTADGPKAPDRLGHVPRARGATGRAHLGPPQGQNVTFVNPSKWLDRPIAFASGPTPAHRAMPSPE